MATLRLVNMAGDPQGEPYRVPSNRRRLSSIVRQRAAAWRDSPYFVFLFREGKRVVLDGSVMPLRRKAQASTRVGPNDTVVIMRLPYDLAVC